MKKTMVSIIASVLSIALFTAVGNVKEYKDGELIDKMTRRAKCGKLAYADAENLSDKIYYADVRIHNKYRLLTFLSNDEDIFAKTFSANADHNFPLDSRRFDLSALTLLLCGKLSGKYVRSSDGTVWMYSENYFVSFAGASPRFALRSSCGMKRKEPEYENSKTLLSLFGSPAYCEESDFPLPGLKRRVFRNSSDSISEIISPSLSSPLLYDFSSFTKNQRNIY